MSTVQDIESAIKKLSAAEMNQVREWLENFLEDQMQFTDDFKARIASAERELASGTRHRVRRP